MLNRLSVNTPYDCINVVARSTSKPTRLAQTRCLTTYFIVNIINLDKKIKREKYVRRNCKRKI